MGTERPDTDDRFDIGESDVDAEAKAHPVVYELVADLSGVREAFTERVVVSGGADARKRIAQAAKELDRKSRGHERYEILRGPLTRLTETMVKCSALLALYRGDTTFGLEDALIAIGYAEEWYGTMVRVVNETSESEFSRQAALIEAYVQAQGGSCTATKLNHRFRSLIQRSPRELSDRIDFLVSSGRLLRKEDSGVVRYEINE